MQLLHNSRDLHAEETDVRIAVNVGERMATASAAGWKLWLALTLHADRQWDDGSPMSSAQGLGDVPKRCKRCPTRKKGGVKRSAARELTTAATTLGQASGGGRARCLDRRCRDGGGFGQAVGRGVLCQHMCGDRQCRPGQPIRARRVAA
jgi:hypothetical protein